MMSTKLRWGILGTGNIAHQFSIGVMGSDRGQLAAVGSRNDESARQFAADHQIHNSHGSYEALMADSNVDAIYNSLPNSMHHEWTIKALNAGKHVLCEKPFANDAAQSQEMFDLARRRGLRVVEAFMYRSNPLTIAAKQALASGVIGELRLIRTSFCYRTYKISGNIRFDRHLGGGGIMDIGCYCVNFARHFAGEEPEQITAAGHFHSSGVDDLAVGTMKFPSGVLASFSCGMSAHADNTAYLCGSEGSIEIPIPWKPPRDNATYVIARGIRPKMDGPVGPAPTGPARQVVTVPVHGDLYGLEADDFAAVVQDGKKPTITEADTMGNMRVLDELRKQIGLKFV